MGIFLLYRPLWIAFSLAARATYFLSENCVGVIGESGGGRMDGEMRIRVGESGSRREEVWGIKFNP